MARHGAPPVVFFDCIRFLSKRSFGWEFTGPIDKHAVLSLKQSYEQGKRPLRSKKVRATINDSQVANLLLLWLGSLPHPLLPVEHAWHLAGSHLGSHNAGSGNDSDDVFHWSTEGSASPRMPTSPKTRPAMYKTLKTLIGCTEPFVLEVLFPLFELLHHFHLNEEHRDESLHSLSTIFTPSVFGTAEDHGLRGPEYEALLREACATLIRDYRGLFTSQPELSREERQPAAEEAGKAGKADEGAAAEDADELGSMISVTFDNIMGDIIAELDEDDVPEGSPQKKKKTGRHECSVGQFMNQHAPVDLGETGSDSSSPTSVL